MATATATRKPRKARDGSTMSKRIQRNKVQAERNVAILDDWDTGEYESQKALGDKYGLTQGAISQIINNPNATVYYDD